MNGLDPANTPRTPPASTDGAEAIRDLRAIMYAVGLGLLCLSAAMNVYLHRQNRLVAAQIDRARKQTEEYEKTRATLQTVLREVVVESARHTNGASIFQRLGVIVSTPQPPAAASP